MKSSGWALAPLLVVLASCDALIGLGEEPSGGAAGAGSTSDGSTSSISATTGTESITSSGSAGGGGGELPSATAGTGTGGGSGEGGGGGGGGEPAPPCGGEDSFGISTCVVPGEGFCKVRVYRIPEAVRSRSTDHYTIANRLGRGMAVLPGGVVFTAAGLDGAGGEAYRVLRVDRATGTWDERPETLPVLTAMTALAPGRVVVAELGGAEGYLRVDQDDWPIDPFPNQSTTGMNAITAEVDRLWGGSRMGAEPFELTPTNDDAPCRIGTTAESGGAAIIDVRIVPWNGALHLLSTNVEVGNVTLTSIGGPCVVGTTTDVGPDIGHVYAAVAKDGEVFAKHSTDGGNTVWLVPLLTGAGDEVPIQTNPTRALAVRGPDLLVPAHGGGILRCSADDLTCSDDLPEETVGRVSEIESFPWGFVMLGYQRTDDGSDGDALVTCVDDRP